MSEITPEEVVADLFAAEDTNYDNSGNGWFHEIKANGNVIEIAITPCDEGGTETDEVAHFRAVVVEGETVPVLLAGPAYVSGDGDGYLYLRCDDCNEIITCIDAGSSLAGLNAEAAGHTCPTGEAKTAGGARD